MPFSAGDLWRTLYRRPHDLLAAILRVPFVDFLTSMTQPELPLTVHEYGEWGDPADPAVLQQVRNKRTYHYSHSNPTLP